jgi:hypothetical protein
MLIDQVHCMADSIFVLVLGPHEQRDRFYQLVPFHCLSPHRPIRLELPIPAPMVCHASPAAMGGNGVVVFHGFRRLSS